MRIGSATRLGALVAILFDAGRDGEVVVAFSIPQNLLAPTMMACQSCYEARPAWKRRSTAHQYSMHKQWRMDFGQGPPNLHPTTELGDGLAARAIWLARV